MYTNIVYHSIHVYNYSSTLVVRLGLLLIG